MSNRIYEAYVVHENDQGKYKGNIEKKRVDDLPKHGVLIRVFYSSLNYKDALSATGHKGITNSYPHIPGIDAAGVIEHSDDRRFKEGQNVIVTSFGLGENTPGGYGQYIRVPGDWLVPMPEGLTPFESMVIGTAGFTAALGVYKLRQNDVFPEDGPILVTGATGGVGSLAVAILGRLGYNITAATGKLQKKDYLMMLGARDVIHRDKVKGQSSKPLLQSRWAGVVDTVGGSILDTAIRQTKPNGAVTCCGNILGAELNTNIYPFILRGVSLIGLDSGRCLMPLRKRIWRLLANEWKPTMLEQIAQEVSLSELDGEIKKILRGDQAGRIVVNLNINAQS
ncbi:YhdH/YhfP family quinone oxidoreductase [Aliifodinibius sp. S!AR15-10]|uniref:YhdH/YhfP family quinone oxidoreductase n=1 Tax=Aliifodinibius sp. S!AR15-10 TaxID=2950437 RepID=UPI00285AB44F|nr:YhdH/YhfP family quinone oxidoreductase [Aliifodinibius sp. S!AR15-10]MDR8393663.1 YhdH/YhfP family quinone oxidoreductase [Aliifodinibius sp. S!AR15-10]